MRFADIIGHDGLKAMLCRTVDEGRISHAQMFAGQSGAGALPLAIAYAQYLNCSDRKGGDSCGVCPSCIKMQGLAHPDLHFVFPTNSPKSGGQKPVSDSFLPLWREMFAETGGYFDEQMWYGKLGLTNQQGLIAKREADEVIRKLSFKSFEANYKTVIIWLPEKMGAEAANGLLKILEEPWDKTLFLLVSVEPHLLLPTIISRVQRTDVVPIELPAIERYLAECEGADSGRTALLAGVAGGNIIELKKVMSDSEADGRREDFDYFTQLMRYSYNDRHIELLDWAESISSAGRENQKRFLKYAVGMLRESYVIHAGMENISYLWGAEREFCMKFAPFVGSHNIERLVEENQRALSHITQNGNPKIVFTHYALSVSKLIGR